MYRNPFSDLIPQTAQQPRSQQPLIQGRPRQPAPRYGDEAARSQYDAQRGPYQVQREAIGVSRDEAELERARLEAEKARREAAQQAAQTPGARIFDNENQLRSQYQGLPAVRNYELILPAYHGAMTAADNRAGDMNLVYGTANIMDPGAVVRESDALMVQRTGQLSEQVVGALRTINGGGELTPEIRRNLRAELQRRGQAIGGAYNQTRQQYEALARRYGFDPAAVIGPHPAAPLRAQLGLDRSYVPTPEGDIGFSGRTISNDTVPLTAEQMRRYIEFMSRQQRGRLTPEALAAGYMEAVGRPINNPEEIARYFNETGEIPQSVSYRNPDAEQLFRERNERDGPGGSEDLLFQGATLGLSDQAGGVGNMLLNAIRSPFTEETFNPGAAYVAGRDAHNMRLDQARERTGLLGTGAELLGGLASGRVPLQFTGGRAVASTLPTPATLPGRMAQGARIGGGVGAVAGAGYNEGPQGSINPLAGVEGAVWGGAGGGLLGGALPVAGEIGRRGVNLARTATGRNPGMSRQMIAQAIEADAGTPGMVGRQMQEAQANGVPYMLADSGDNVRGLLAASTRAPGPGRTLARDALEQRQQGLSERVAGAVERDLGPAPNVDDAADEIMGQARQAAAPLYEAAYARPGADTFGRRVSSLLRRPSMRRALQRAHRIAEEEGRDPTTAGFEINAAGEVTVTRTPSWQTFDYVKRGMDDVIESYRDPTTRRLNLDEEGRAINNTLRSFLAQADVANPEWAAARAAWAGPVRTRSAMEAGRRALLASPDDIHRATREMSASELDFFRLGVRRAIVDQVSRRGDSADSVNAIIGTPARRNVLSRLFGGRPGFDRFIRTLQAEREGHLTFRRATQGSPTAQNLQDDTALESGVASVAADMMTTGTPIITAMRQAARYGTGRSGDQARQEIAALLSETDPARLTELARELQKEAARRRAAQRGAGRRSTAYGRGAGQVVPMIGPPD